VPRIDPLTFGSPDRPWIDLQWLFEVILATVFAAGGVQGVVLLTAVVGTSALLAVLIAPDQRWPSWVVVSCWLPALVAMSARFLPRPELYSLLGIAIYLTVLRRSDTRPALAGLLPPLQVLWVNVHALFPLGAFIMSAYVIDRLAASLWIRALLSERSPAASRWWRGHDVGATIADCLASLAISYGLQGVPFPLELLPNITAWGGLHKSYIAEFMDFRDYVQLQGTEAAGGNVFVLAGCFLLSTLPGSFFGPAIWRSGWAARSRGAASAPSVAWILALGSAIGLPVTSLLGLAGASTSAWLVRAAGFAPIRFCALGVVRAVLALPGSRLAPCTRFVLRYLRLHSFFSLPGGRVRRLGLELLTRYLQPRFRRGNGRISQVPGEPQVSVRHVQSTPAGLLAPDDNGAAARPLVSEKQWLPRKVFRRSIARLSDSLSTLRSTGYPLPTQDSLLPARRDWSDSSGRAFHLQGSDERFSSAVYISSSSPKLAWRNRTDRSVGLTRSGDNLVSSFGYEVIDIGSGPGISVSNVALLRNPVRFLWGEARGVGAFMEATHG
jgi:hypothetical protein